ncbi:hypothetical protein GCM10010981_03350 [Dyella nitratireducens]|uniref:Uncharacterized protein n=1 Tax=Dyella nitratireducens TaxID=1849580 RepID=A0ABQ1FJS9_9GAMM|nr:hypothetical protein GCM10010981_03350 [Dyella nitratireducens]GLQ44604.1 hypothetical protein GCM10007902_44540 [Dyella nitratireducens]
MVSLIRVRLRIDAHKKKPGGGQALKERNIKEHVNLLDQLPPLRVVGEGWGGVKSTSR